MKKFSLYLFTFSTALAAATTWSFPPLQVAIPQCGSPQVAVDASGNSVALFVQESGFRKCPWAFYCFLAINWQVTKFEMV